MSMLEEYVRDLAELVNRDCGTTNCAGVTSAAEVMKRHFESIGWEAELVDLGPTAGRGLICRKMRGLRRTGSVNLTKRIEDGPFWACYTGMTVHHTMGGINTNVKAQALDWEGKVIPGLYAAGEITGGIHGTNRVGGNAVLDCFVFGQIAGENAAKEVA